MISVNFLPSISSSYTYMVTRSSKLSKRAAFAPTIFAIADPLFEESERKENELISHQSGDK